MVEVLQDEASIGIVYADRIVVDEYGSFLERSPSGRAEDLYLINRIGACFLYRREVTAALNGYDEDLFGAEDYDFWLRAALQFRYHHLGQFLYYYRVQGESLTAEVPSGCRETSRRRWQMVAAGCWPDEETRLQAHVEWGVRCLTAGVWERSVTNRGCGWRTGSPQRCGPACGGRCSRGPCNWPAPRTTGGTGGFWRYRPYLLEVADDPQVARFLAARRYPKWVYGVKDRLSGLQRRLRSWKGRLTGVDLLRYL